MARCSCRQLGVFEKFCIARSALQLIEFQVKAREVEVMVQERQAWSKRQRAACEWLDEDLQQAVKHAGKSQLVDLQQQVSCSTKSTGSETGRINALQHLQRLEQFCPLQ